MADDYSSIFMVYLIRILGFVSLPLVIYATVNILQSIWFRFWGSRNMDDRAKREFYIQKKYDIKWTFCLTIVCILGSIIFWLSSRSDLAFLELLCAYLFWLLLWGNYRTLNLERERLNKKKDLGI